MLADTERFPSHTWWIYAAWLHTACTHSSSSCHRALVLCWQYQLFTVLLHRPYWGTRICLPPFCTGSCLICNHSEQKMQSAESQGNNNKNVIYAGQINTVLPIAWWLTSCSKVCQWCQCSAHWHHLPPLKHVLKHQLAARVPKVVITS